ncbi:MAG: hypothetical protein R2810_14055 [Flavobacteriales bacterium]
MDLNGLLGGGQDPGGSWTDPDGAAHGNVFDPQVDPGGAYIHVVPGAGACPDDTATVLVNVLAPSVDAGPDLTLCQGDTVQLSGSGAGALIWSPALGLSDPNVPDPWRSHPFQPRTSCRPRTPMAARRPTACC